MEGKPWNTITDHGGDLLWGLPIVSLFNELEASSKLRDEILPDWGNFKILKSRLGKHKEYMLVLFAVGGWSICFCELEHTFGHG
jgi:hypothetical protein